MAVPRVGIGAYSGHVGSALSRTPGSKCGGRPKSECPSGLFSDRTGWPCRRTDTSQTACSRPSTNLKIKSHHQPLTLRDHPLPCDGTEVAPTLRPSNHFVGALWAGETAPKVPLLAFRQAKDLSVLWTRHQRRAEQGLVKWGSSQSQHNDGSRSGGRLARTLWMWVSCTARGAATRLPSHAPLQKHPAAAKHYFSCCISAYSDF